jgi:hypothetical protein
VTESSANADERSLVWLHLTDLHVGQPKEGQRRLNIEAAVLRDLDTVSEHLAQPIDVVIFSGDLVFRGSDAEYIMATAVLGRILGHIQRLNRKWVSAEMATPVLIPTPGNHDLARPSQEEAETVLRSLGSRKPQDRALWSTGQAAVQKIVYHSFAAYERWLRDHPLPFPPSWRAGVVPGDRIATVRRHGVSIGIVALNSAYLHFDDNAVGKLHIDSSQLGALATDPDHWAKSHHFNVLITHHPSSWLSEVAQTTLNGEIRANRRFDLHLYGHEHVGAHRTEPGSTGIRHLLEGRSLFGAEEHASPRIHGYGVGRFVLKRSKTSGVLTKHVETWTRPGWRDDHGWHFGPGDREHGSWRLIIDLGTSTIRLAERDSDAPSWDVRIGDRGLNEDLWRKVAVRDDLATLFGGLDCKHWVLLSASVPRNDRGDLSPEDCAFVDSARPDAIEAFVVELAKRIEGRQDIGLVFGGHPAIALALGPMILASSRERPWIALFQDQRYQQIFAEALGVIIHSPVVQPVLFPEALGTGAPTQMRDLMIAVPGLIGAVFIGGKSGTIDEFTRVGEQRADVWRVAVGLGGGAAASLLLTEKYRDQAVPAGIKVPGRLWHTPADAVDEVAKLFPPVDV